EDAPPQTKLRLTGGSRRGIAGKSRPRWPVWSGDRGLVFGVQIFSHDVELTQLEFRETQTPPAFCSAAERAEHQLQDGLPAESIRHDLHPPTFFAEQALDQIRRAGRATMCNWQA